jgi:hypothetical protein
MQWLVRHPKARRRDRKTASAQPGEGWSALVRIIVLAALTLWAFGEETIKTFAQATSMVQSSYVLATPVLIGLLIHRRRYRLRAALGSGSVWGWWYWRSRLRDTR